MMTQLSSLPRCLRIAALGVMLAVTVGGRAEAEPPGAGDPARDTVLGPTGIEMASELAKVIARCVARHDTRHDAFHGCIDWHSAVHGTWALIAYMRLTGDMRHAPLVAQSLSPGLLARERTLLAAKPDFEMPYGRAWLLRLAREHELAFGNGALRPIAEDALASLLAYYGRHPPSPRRGSYHSDSWALINMHEYASWTRNSAALQTIRGWVEGRFVTYEGTCSYDVESGHFMAVCTNWAWLVSLVLEPGQLETWARAFFAKAGLPRPVTQPINWHHHGLNFSRAWGLWGLYSASRTAAMRQAYLAAYTAHLRATYERPSQWRGSYLGVAHWVPQFGMLALQPLLELRGRSP